MEIKTASQQIITLSPQDLETLLVDGTLFSLEEGLTISIELNNEYSKKLWSELQSVITARSAGIDIEPFVQQETVRYLTEVVG